MTYQEIKEFKKGLITAFEDHSIPSGSSSSSKNWLSKGDRIELRRGTLIYGTELTGNGEVDGLHVTTRADGTQVMFRKRGRKLEYYSGTAWVETGTNLFPAEAESDEVMFADYASLAGNQLFFSSPNSGMYKIMVANPGSYTDLTDSAKNFKGYIRIKQNRMFLFGRNEDKTGIYGSYIDKAVYTAVSAESLGTGDGTTVTFTGTLAFKASGSVRTAFAVTVKVNSVITLTDDYNGNLKDTAGVVRGTINYTTGAYSITFAAAPGNTLAITADYQWENSNNTGITDFTKSATRLAGQGFIFRQDDGGGEVQSIESYNGVEYCLHKMKTWELTLTATDTAATNLVYRDRVGIPNKRAAIATGEGIYYADDNDQADPKFRLMTINNQSTRVIPIPVSEQLKLADYRFDKAATAEWGDYVVFACRYKSSAKNDTVFTYNRRYKAWDRLDYAVSCFAVYNGALVAGDSLTDNVYELLSGFDDTGSTVDNYWEGNLEDHNIQTLKKTRKLWIQGEISRNQSLEFYLATDKGSYVLIGTQNGTDDNVDTSSRSVLGSEAIGSDTLGGQSSTDVYSYTKEIRLANGRYKYLKLKVIATEIGYASVSTVTYFDIIQNASKLPIKYRSN